MGLLEEKIAFLFMSRRTKASLILLSVLLMGCQQSVETLPFYNGADFTATWIEEGQPAYEQIHTIRPFAFQDQENELVTNKTFEGKVYAANFFFTSCPSICPNMTENLKLVQEAYMEDDEVLLLSHTVMPWVDSIPRLREYANNHDIQSSKWHLVTGAQSEIYELARQSYFAEKEMGLDSDSNEFLHTENVLLIDGKGRIRGIYNGTLRLEMERLIEDIGTLKKKP